VRRHAGREIGKHETRSDWLARPLSEQQLAYAVEDVAYLCRIRDHQRGELERLGRLSWFEAECRERCRLSVSAPEGYYRTVRGAARCTEAELRRLRRACAWRERKARERDLPRGRVVKDEELLDLVVLERPDREAIFERLHPGAARRYWREILDELQAADAEDESVSLDPVPRPLGRAENDAVKALKDRATARAEALGMAPELLARRRDLEACVRAFAETGHLSATFGEGWRSTLLGPEFEEVLASAKGLRS
jgi:ribonuclease D